MKDFILERMKAVAGVVMPGVGALIVKAVEAFTGFDIPTEWELVIISFVTGLGVHQVKNKQPSQ